MSDESSSASSPGPEPSDVRSFTDLRTAMTAALMRFLLDLRFDLPRTDKPFGIKRVLGDWATFSDRAPSRFQKNRAPLKLEGK